MEPLVITSTAVVVVRPDSRVEDARFLANGADTESGVPTAVIATDLMQKVVTRLLDSVDVKPDTGGSGKKKCTKYVKILIFTCSEANRSKRG